MNLGIEARLLKLQSRRFHLSRKLFSNCIEPFHRYRIERHRMH
jgi:hypothetical protein